MILEFREAFEILEIEPTDDKKKIKIAYSKMLKKYHPEDFPEMFMRINEAYRIALEFEKSDFDEVKSENETTEKNNENTEFFERVKKNFEENKEKSFFGNFEDIFSEGKNTSEFEDIFSNKNNYENEKTFEKNKEEKENTNNFEKKEKQKKSISEWLEQFRKLIFSENRPLYEYDILLSEYHYNFDDFEKRQIREILEKNNDWSNITEIEKKLLIYNLGDSNEKNDIVLDILGKNQRKSKTNNKILDEITKKIKSKNILENENGYEIFIQNYLNVMVFKMFGINITLYPFNALGKDKNVFKYILRRIGMHMLKDEYESEIKNSYREISNSMKIFNNKNEEDSKNNFKFVMTVMSSIMMVLYLISIICLKFLAWMAAMFTIICIIYVFKDVAMIGIILFTIIDWINIVNEKEFKWSKKYGISSYLSILLISGIILIGKIIQTSDEASVDLGYVPYLKLILQYIFFNAVIITKMIVTTNIRYKRLKDFSKQVLSILDVFVLKKYQGGNENGKNDWN